MHRRTTLITAAAIAGVTLAGSAAVAANIGILNAADDDNVGTLSAAAVTTTVDVAQTTVEPQVIDIYIDDPATDVTSTIETSRPRAAEQYLVDGAGTVDIERTTGGILLDAVTPNPGWTWTSSQSAADRLTVSFTSGDSEYVFAAELAADGTITARVDEPIVEVVRAPAPTRTSPPSSAATPSYEDDDGSDDDHDDVEDHDDHDEDDDDDHDEDDEDDHEDRDDDHEGGDDDD